MTGGVRRARRVGRRTGGVRRRRGRFVALGACPSPCRAAGAAGRCRGCRRRCGGSRRRAGRDRRVAAVVQDAVADVFEQDLVGPHRRREDGTTADARRRAAVRPRGHGANAAGRREEQLPPGELLVQLGASARATRRRGRGARGPERPTNNSIAHPPATAHGPVPVREPRRSVGRTHRQVELAPQRRRLANARSCRGRRQRRQQLRRPRPRASGSTTKARSRHSGCGTTRSGSFTTRSPTSSTSTSNVRGPQCSVRTRPAASSKRLAQLQQLARRSSRLQRHDHVEERALSRRVRRRDRSPRPTTGRRDRRSR